MPVSIGGKGWGVVLAALLLSGGAGGFAAAHLLDPAPTGESVPIPLSGESAGGAGMPPGKPRPDADLPPLEPSTTSSPQTLGVAPWAFEIPIPDGWDSIVLETPTDTDGGEWRYGPPGAPSGAYTVRVERLDGSLVPYTMVLEREKYLAQDPSITDLRFVSDTTKPSGTLAFTFLKDGFRKLSIVRFASLPGSNTADVEIAWTGRLGDEAGMRQLLHAMVAGLKPVQ